MTYAQFLYRLIALGPQIPEALARLERIIAEITELAAMFGSLFPQQVVDITDADLAAEDALAQAIASPGTQAAFDGSKLRAIFAFLQSTGLLNILLAKALGG
jgi:hypothetical protein